MSPDSSRVTWVTGLYYFHDIETLPSSFSEVVTNLYAGFGEGSIELLPRNPLDPRPALHGRGQGTVGQLRYYSQPEPPGSVVPPLTAVPTTVVFSADLPLGQ